MFKEFFNFELRHRFKQPMVYIFFLVTALLYFMGVALENMQIGMSVRNIHVNSPYAILGWSAFYAFIGLMFTTAFANTSALRDFNYKYDGILFSTPLKKAGFFFGRFWGACLAAVVPALGIFFAIIIGSQMPWVSEKIGAFYPMAYIESLFYFIIPNVFLASAIIFTIAILTRSTIASFIGAIAMMVGYGIAIDYVSDLENETLGVMLDPFGINSFFTLTKYWTIGDKNTSTLGLNFLLLANRMLWFGIGVLILVFGYMRFSFTAKKSKKKSKEVAPSATLKPTFMALKALPKVQISDNAKIRWLQLWAQTKVDFWGIIKSTTFIVVILFGLLNMGTSLSNANRWYGLTMHPVTYSVVNLIQGTLYLFILIIMVFYSGVVVWKERDAKMDGIYNALPYPTWIPFLAKYIAVIGILAVIQLIAILTGVTTQALFGYFNFELDVYFKQFFLIDWVGLALATLLSMLVHALVNNKYLAYFVFLVVFFLNGLIWIPLDVQSKMVSFAADPDPTYSDMNGYGPYVTSLIWFKAYWILFAAMLGILTILFWVRESSATFKQRWGIAKRRFAGNYKLITAVFAFLWLLTAGFVYYNTQVINTYATPDEIEENRVAYETKYKQYQDIPQPRITEVKYDINIFPYDRDVKIGAKVWAKNKSAEPIQEIHFNMPIYFDATVEFQRPVELTSKDTVLNYWIYKLQSPLEVGDSLQYTVQSDYITQGFENDVSFTQVVSNGTFFNNYDFMPVMGYQESTELSDKKDRKEHELTPKPNRMPELQHNCTKACMNTYLSNESDWVMVECTISTSPDQIAVAPGSLRKEWEEDGRRYFHYKLDHPSLNFYSFISARYEVARDKWNDVDMEVYYHKGHEYNVDKMLKSIRKSLEYNTNNFSPYRHKQARIIEFPRYASFAQAFPGTMPYSESIGFIADIEDEEEDIDMVFYVVAHEMAHQWWAHQVIGANMQGGTVLSETFAQYSALMTMEKEYGRKQMKKFLKYEMDRYLRGRGGETLKEMPLMQVENQPYIHYRKGSVIMYALKEFIGEETLNGALKALVDSTAYREPPYPTTLTLMGLLEEATPDSLQYLLTDMFEEITLYSNRTLEASYKKLDNGKYEVTLKTETKKFKADSIGNETEVERLNDWVDIGIYATPSNTASSIDGSEKKKKEELIYQERVRINQAENTFTVEVDHKPERAGIDPNHILIDRVPDDNVKKVDEGD